MRRQTLAWARVKSTTTCRYPGNLVLTRGLGPPNIPNVSRWEMLCNGCLWYSLILYDADADVDEAAAAAVVDDDTGVIDNNAGDKTMDDDDDVGKTDLW